jgi:DNA-binding transcriptional MerR regulator
MWKGTANMKLLSIGEVSLRSGVTVRALRHYEKLGLITPQRTEARQRVYAYRDITRLNHIQMLKRTGLTLAKIKEMITSTHWNAVQILEIQKEMATQQLKKAETRLRLIDETLTRVANGEPANLSTLCHIIKMGDHAMSDEKWQKVWDKFYTDEEQKRWADAKKAVPEDVIKANEQAWPALLARAEELVGTDPAAPEAQAVVKEWQALAQVILDIDPKLADATAKLYDNLDDWPEDGAEPPFSQEVWAFIKAAEAVTS